MEGRKRNVIVVAIEVFAVRALLVLLLSRSLLFARLLLSLRLWL